MLPRTLTRLAMTVAGFMIAHQVAAKAARDALFLSAWPATALPSMVIATAFAVVAAVPIYSRLLAAYGPRAVVSIGFAISAAGHLVEWQLDSALPWVAVAIYLHVAGIGALLLSGFWSLLSEIFDPQAAKVSYGRIAAAGTFGGLVGGAAVLRLAATLPVDAVLIFLAVVHAACAGGVWVIGGYARARPHTPAPERTGTIFGLETLRTSPHLRTIALMVVLGTAGAAILDFLLKWRAAERFGSEAALLSFFAAFYTGIQVITFAAQLGVGGAISRLGIGRTVATLPAGLGLGGAIALLYPTFPVLVGVRSLEWVIRGSLFRSGYELLFVPMNAEEKRRTKTLLDVTCDRTGDAIGAAIVQLLLLTSPLFLPAELLAFVLAMAAGGLWLGRRLDRLYVGVVERELVKHGDRTPLVLASETGWTVLDLPPELTQRSFAAAAAWPGAASGTHPIPRPVIEDPRLRLLGELQSGDRRRVEAALSSLTRPDTLIVAQVVRLLAWDDVCASARIVLERAANAHTGLLLDALLDPDTDFAIRRRIPRVLGTLSSPRALNGLVHGLDDARFEVRYQCGRAIDRVLVRNPELSVEPDRIMKVVERELSVSHQIWTGHRLIDGEEADDDPIPAAAPGRAQRNLAHIFSLLSAVLPREPMAVALRGIGSDDPSLRSLAIEYLDSVLAPEVRGRLWFLIGDER